MRRELRYSIGILLLKKTSSAVSPTDIACLEFCQAIVPDCTSTTICNPANICQGIFWTDASRESAFEHTGDQVPFDESIPVSCDDAVAFFENSNNTADSSESEQVVALRGLKRPRNIEGEEEILEPESARQRLMPFFSEEGSSSSQIEEDSAEQPSPVVEEVEEIQDPDPAIPEEEAEGSDSSSFAMLEDGDASAALEEGNDDNDASDTTSDTMVQGEQEAVMTVVNDGEDQDPEWFQGDQGTVILLNGQLVGTSVLNWIFQVPQRLLDPLNNDELWEEADLVNGRKIQSVMEQVVDVLNVELLQQMIAFPFLDVSKEESVREGQFLIESFSDEISHLIPNPSDYEQLGDLITEIPTIGRWKSAMSAMAGVSLNVELAEPQLFFARNQILMFRRFFSAIGKYQEGMFSSMVWTILNGETAPHSSIPLTIIQEAVRPSHSSVVCSFCCRLISTSRSSNLNGNGNRPKNILQLAESLERHWMMENRSTKALRSHFICLADLVVDNDIIHQQKEFCRIWGDKIFGMIFSSYVQDPHADPLTSSERVSVLRMARRCISSMSVKHRRESIPTLLESYHFDPSNGFPPIVRIQVSQSAHRILQDTLENLSTLDKIDFLFGKLAVKFTGFTANGVGTLHELISRVIPKAFLPSSGLFIYSDSREIFMKPAPLPVDDADARATQTRNLRQVGRLVALALQKDVVPDLFLTKGSLFLLTQNREKISDTMLLDMLQEEDPEKFNSLIRLRESIVGLEGMPFPNGAETLLDNNNVEEFILAQAKAHVLDSIAEQINCVLQGIYDILPYQQLAWLVSPDEFQPLFEGSRNIDIGALRRSATVYYTSYFTADDTNRVVEWFWIIVSRMTREYLGKLLQFVSGSKFPPIHGFTGPNDNRTWLQIFFDPTISENGLPKSQLCFLQLKLPIFSDITTMEKRIECAITECESLENT